MSNQPQTTEPPPNCTAFDHFERIASGGYVEVALAVGERLRHSRDASVLIFDDASGQQIDFDVRGTADDIRARINSRSAPPPQSPRPPGRPKLGVVAREVTLLPRHWEWLAQQPGGASVTLRKLVEAARQQPPNERQRKLLQQERAYRFMSALAGNLPNFEEAARALFGDDLATLRQLIGAWPQDVQAHILQLLTRSPAEPRGN